MKKIVPVLLSVFIAFSLCACANSQVKKETPEGVQATQKTENKDETFGLNETAVFPNLKMTAKEIKLSQGSQFNRPGSGKVFVGVKFMIENISDEDQIISSMLLFDPYVDGTKEQLSAAAIVAFKKGLDGTLASGKKMEGYYSLELSKKSKLLELQVQDSFLSGNKAIFKINIPKK